MKLSYKMNCIFDFVPYIDRYWFIIEPLNYDDLPSPYNTRKTRLFNRMYVRPDWVVFADESLCYQTNKIPHKDIENADIQVIGPSANR